MSQLSLHLGAPLFGGYRVRIDPWDVNYGEQIALDSTEHEERDEVDHELELPEEQWRPISPARDAVLPYRRVVFIDGVRRLDARLQVVRGQRLIHGAFGSYAVGAVELAPDKASFGEHQIRRQVVLGAGELLPQHVSVHPALTYEPVSTKDPEPNAPLRYIQDAMRLEEGKLAARLCDGETLTIVDGPLSFEPSRGTAALGYVKRIHELYLPSRLLPMLAMLPAGARTPMFSLARGSGLARFSWFQRLATPGPGASEMHGLVRLEASISLGVETARSLADAATQWLCKVAPSRARDPRSPQNLLPISALERRLRIVSGDASLTRRWIEVLVAKESAHV